MKRLLSALFGCPHARTTFPLTVRRRTYVVCLECGAEKDYSWQDMRLQTRSGSVMACDGLSGAGGRRITEAAQ